MKKTIIIILFLVKSVALNAQDRLQQILDNENRGTKHKLHKTIYDNSGHYTSIPIVIIKGKQKGPIISILSGVHGYEYPPIIAAQELIQEIDPNSLTGTLLILPMVSPNSFYSRTPFLNPQDQINLNRTFPGDIQGSITEKIAYFITNSIIASSNVFIDIHGGDANEDLLPFVCYYNNSSKPEQTQMARLLSETSGFQYVVSYPYTLNDNEPALYAFKQAVQDGKVGVSIECGKLGQFGSNEVKQIKHGVYNMLSKLKSYKKISEEKVDFIHLDKQFYIKSNHKGIFESSSISGDFVRKGDLIGKVKNEFGDELAKVYAKESGIILYKIGTPPVNVGETIMCIGVPKE